MYSLIANVAALFSTLKPIPSMAPTITNLTAATFDDFISSHEVVMVQFFAPWCVVCTDMAPLYEYTAATHQTAKDIKFARVDCVEDRELCMKWKTPMYPTFRVFKGMGEQEIYNGPRTPADLIEAVEWFWLPEVYDNETLTISQSTYDV